MAQAPDAEIPHTTTSDEKNDVIGTITPPTTEQKKQIKTAAKKAKIKKKHKSAKKHIKNKAQNK